MSIFKRVSIRDFTDKKVEKDKLELILRAGMQAPSAVNQQPWEFLVCDDREAILKCADLGGFARSLKSAPMMLVLYSRESVSHQNFVPQDMAACAENCLLEAAELGLGAVWMGIYPKEDRIADCEAVFGKRDGLRPFAFIALGYPAEDKKQISRFDHERIHYYKK